MVSADYVLIGIFSIFFVFCIRRRQYASRMASSGIHELYWLWICCEQILEMDGQFFCFFKIQFCLRLQQMHFNEHTTDHTEKCQKLLMGKIWFMNLLAFSCTFSPRFVCNVIIIKQIIICFFRCFYGYWARLLGSLDDAWTVFMENVDFFKFWPLFSTSRAEKD